MPHINSTAHTEEINNFEKMAAHWWDESGPFKPLHQMNPIRLTFIKNVITEHFSLEEDDLKGLRILDVGCGGGLLCEPLARLGATVTGIDASPTAIQVAKEHAEKSGLKIDYRCQSPEELEGETFDVVVALEVIEHVANMSSFLDVLTNLTKEIMIFSTLNRTWCSYIKAIIGAEYILRWIPVGTHQWAKFVQPAELASWLRHFGFDVRSLSGMSFHPITQSWSLSDDLSVNYLASAVQFK